MYSQNDEEAHILEHLKGRTGRLLDIGANDGRYASNSLALIERGWHAVLVEANPFTFQRLYERHGDNPRVTLVNAAVGNKALTPFWPSTRDGGPDPHQALSTTEYAQVTQRKEAAGFRRPFFLPMLPLSALLAGSGTPFDFITLDTEGTSVDLFLELPLQAIQPSVICVEHNGMVHTCRTRAKDHDYEEVSCNAENLMFVHKTVLRVP